MSKAILVIDLPTNLDIPLEDIKTEITISSKDKTKSLLHLKYGRVKLKPMPNKISPTDIFRKNLNGLTFVDGWNACLKEIEE